jgi:3-deoxy-D-manno-octulosonic acid (KDO) 8-phosphate synthase
LFIEVHDDPPAALSDASTQLPIETLQRLLEETLRVHSAANTRVVDQGVES